MTATLSDCLSPFGHQNGKKKPGKIFVSSRLEKTEAIRDGERIQNRNYSGWCTHTKESPPRRIPLKPLDPSQRDKIQEEEYLTLHYENRSWKMFSRVTEGGISVADPVVAASVDSMLIKCTDTYDLKHSQSLGKINDLWAPSDGIFNMDMQ